MGDLRESTLTPRQVGFLVAELGQGTNPPSRRLSNGASGIRQRRRSNQETPRHRIGFFGKLPSPPGHEEKLACNRGAARAHAIASHAQQQHHPRTINLLAGYAFLLPVTSFARPLRELLPGELGVRQLLQASASA